MHVQGPGGGRNVAIVFVQHALDVFPFHFFHRRRFGPQVRWCVQRFKAIHQLVHGNRLAQVVGGAAAHGFHRRGNTAVTSQHQYVQVWLLLQKFRQQLQATFPGQVEIQNTPVHRPGADGLQSAVSIAGAECFNALARQRAGQHLEKRLVIVDQQPEFLSSHGCISSPWGRATGKSMTMVVPVSPALARRLPPSRWIVALERNNPTPRPWWESTMSSPGVPCRAVSRPSPWSSTTTSTRPDSDSWLLTATQDGLAVRAFASRLSTAWSSVASTATETSGWAPGH